MKVLIVDDEKLAVETLFRVMDWENYSVGEVYKAYSMKQACALCEQYEIDIIFCDIEMPRGSGLDFVEWLRETGRDPVVLFLTSHAVFTYARQAVSLGVTDYLLKPFQKQEIDAAMKKAVAIAAERRKGRLTRKKIRKLGGETNPLEESISRVKRYIDEHMEENLTREDLAGMVHLNADYLSKQFKKEYGMALMDYVGYVRLERARQMLEDSALTVSEIALAAGYSNTAYFTKMFKKAYGVTPTGYRKNLSGRDGA